MLGDLKALANGKVSRTGTLLQFSADKLELEVLEGQKLSGEFTAVSLADKKIRGICYTTGLRMNCLTPQFEGTSVNIRYEYDSAGLREGDVEKGYFSLVCNQCEYSLSFVVTVVRPYAISGIGKIKNTTDFARLSEKNWEEAKRIYRSAAFRGLFKEEESYAALLYQMLLPGARPGNSMNEFLIATGRKKKNSFRLEAEEASFRNLDQKIKESVDIRMEGYGSLYLTVSTDSAFLRPLKSQITTEDFIGRIYPLEYMVDPHALRAGINIGKIVVEDSTKSETFTVTVRTDPLSEEEKKERALIREVKTNRAKLTELYLSFRLKRIVTGEWAKKTVDICRHLSALQPENPWWKLISAQAYLVNRQRQDARWILDAHRREKTAYDDEVHGYYLYLCSLSEREQAYVDKMAFEVEELYHRNPESLILFWIRLFLREELTDSESRRYDALKMRYEFGATSPFLYLEAFFLMHQDPSLVLKLDRFEVRVLLWAGRHDALSRDLVLRITTLTSVKKDFDPVLVKVLGFAYRKFPSDDLIMTACTYLVRTEQYGKPFFFWYEKGVSKNMRITGLNEAYLLSMDENDETELPKVLQMYFRYQSSLPTRKVALLFARIVKEKKENPERYLSFRKTMESFAIAQMEEGHIDENLAVIYHDLLKDGLVNREIAQAMEPLMFSFLVRCPNPKMKLIHVRHSELEEEQTVPVINQKAYISLYTRNYCIVAEDQYGCRYSALSAGIEIQPMMKPRDYLKRCMQRAGLSEKYILYDISGKELFIEPMQEKKEELFFLLADPGITDSFKARLLPQMLRTFGDVKEVKALLSYVRKMDVELLDSDAVASMLKLLIQNRYYEEASLIIAKIGTERIDAALLVPLLSYEIRVRDYEEDEYLKNLTFDTFRRKKYDEVMLQYLCRYLNAPSEDLAELYRVAKNFGLETYDLAERLLTQMLYTRRLEPGAFDVFRDYLEEGGSDIVIHAYLNYTADSFFVRGIPAEPQILDLLRRRDEQGEEETEIEKLAVLLHFSKERNIAEAHIEQTERLLSEALSRGLIFPFYLALPHGLVEKYQLYDKTFLEFRSDPEKQVYVHYALSDLPEEFLVQEMQHMYGGIFVSQFILFFGESIQYYITEEDDEVQKVAGSGEITKSDVYGQEEENRFDALNEILLHTTLREEEEAVAAIRSYEAKDALTKGRFPIL